MSEFMHCENCQASWLDRDAFLGDPEIVLIGYQAHFKEEVAGVFLFDHRSPDCHSTLASTIAPFQDLFEGTKETKDGYGDEKCEHRCQRTEDLAACHNHCKRAWVRLIAQEILRITGRRDLAR